MSDNDEEFETMQNNELPQINEALFDRIFQETQDNFTLGKALEAREAGDRIIPECTSML